MRDYVSEEIQDISANFRNVARRLSRTDYSQCYQGAQIRTE